MAFERAVVKRTRALLTSAGAKIIKTSGQGEPDLIGVYQGFCFAIECKQDREKGPTPLQAARLREWRAAGAIVFWTDFPAEALLKVQEGAALRLSSLRSLIEQERVAPKGQYDRDHGID